MRALYGFQLLMDSSNADHLTSNCSRCNVIQIDQKTAVSSEEPLATLARYRKLSGSKIYFGMNAWLLEGEGQEIRLGDSVRVE